MADGQKPLSTMEEARKGTEGSIREEEERGIKERITTTKGTYIIETS